MSERFLTAEELAARYQVTRQHIQNLVNRGLPSLKLGRARRFDVEQTDLWLRARWSARAEMAPRTRGSGPKAAPENSSSTTGYHSGKDERTTDADELDDIEVALAQLVWSSARRYSDRVRTEAGWRAEYRKAGVL